MRLIDADALEKELKKDIMGGLNYSWYINNAPTVDVLDKIRDEVNKLKKVSDGNKVYVGINDVFDIIDKNVKE